MTSIVAPLLLHRGRSVCALLIATCACHGVLADDIAGRQLHWDNDVWAKVKTDRWYTNGLRFSWTYKKPPTTTVGQWLSEGSKFFLWDNETPTVGYSIGQTMYTPRDITQSAPQPNDRPWGAFLFAGATAHAYKGDEFRATELKLGTAGRYAAGEWAQTVVHRLIDSDRPQGWDQQLRTRPGLQLSHARVYRFGQSVKGNVFGFQAGWGATVGTLRTYANVNAALIVGDLDGANPPLMIANEGDFVVQDFNNRPSFNKLFAFAAINATAVAYNYFLDGRTPYGRSDVERKRSYTMVQWGLSLPLHKWFDGRYWPRVVYSQSSRSAEFSSPAVGRDEHRQRWGTFSFNWDTE